MKLLLDTHLLLWIAGRSPRLSSKAAALVMDPSNELYFSVVSIWELVIKRSLDRSDLRVDPSVLRTALLARGYKEIEVRADHVLRLAALPPLHKDPFDRILIAQAAEEGITLVTSDAAVAAYGDGILTV